MKNVILFLSDLPKFDTTPKFGVCANLGKTSVKTPLTPKKTCHTDTNLSGADTEITRAIGEELVRQCLRGVKSCTSEPVHLPVRHQRMKNSFGTLFSGAESGEKSVFF